MAQKNSKVKCTLGNNELMLHWPCLTVTKGERNSFTEEMSEKRT